MEIETALHDLLSNIRGGAAQARQAEPRPQVALPNQPLTREELGSSLATLGRIYGYSLMGVIQILDRVSGHLPDLEAVLQGNRNLEWSQEEDIELGKAESTSVQKLLAKWKGEDSVRRRKAYLGIK